MFEERLQSGMDWVAARVQHLAQDHGVDVTPLGWDADIIDLKAERHLLVVLVNGHRDVIALDDATLAAVVADPLSQLLVDGRLRAFLNDESTGRLPRIA